VRAAAQTALGNEPPGMLGRFFAAFNVAFLRGARLYERRSPRDPASAIALSFSSRSSWRSRIWC